MSLTLRQNGSKVKGQGVLGTAEFSVDGGVEGEVFSGQIGTMKFGLTVTGNEMTGQAEVFLQCFTLCVMNFHRVGADK